ncbi:Hypothetical_protein [Hexamita inflata]|uniref:Hypothetical_protein n=1 Tax=Hexamita inflata TaxID=28002 RepID=A0AA86N5P6_9EUKA|nr:Hypothetical protein HINF_LOCUS958 [Hexamita inflata]
MIENFKVPRLNPTSWCDVGKTRDVGSGITHLQYYMYKYLSITPANTNIITTTITLIIINLSEQQVKYQERYVYINKIEKIQVDIEQTEKIVKGCSIFVTHVQKKQKSIQRDFSQFFGKITTIFSYIQKIDLNNDQ